MLFLFVPETFWDRTPTRAPSKRPSFLRRLSSRHNVHTKKATAAPTDDGINSPQGPSLPAQQSAVVVNNAPSAEGQGPSTTDAPRPVPTRAHHSHKNLHVGFSEPGSAETEESTEPRSGEAIASEDESRSIHQSHDQPTTPATTPQTVPTAMLTGGSEALQYPLTPSGQPVGSSTYRSYTSPSASASHLDHYVQSPGLESESLSASSLRGQPTVRAYTHNLRQQPPRSFAQHLKPFHGRLNHDKWLKVMVRPFILFAYPAVLWSSIVYACSIGWLIVVSELLAVIYRDPDTYNFDALQTGLVYISPFIGGVLGTAVAGKISDILVRALARRNGGLYEPEFRLIMGIPIAITTVIGLMGFGWSASAQDHWMVPTFFFGTVSFGCALGSTTSITFCVDSYRQYAGEALVTLNFTKNILHGLVFSLFVSHWMAGDGPKTVFIWIGVIQLCVIATTIPMYIFGKRARMWTVRRNLMEKF